MIASTTIDPKVDHLRKRLPAVARTGYFNVGTNGPLPVEAHDALAEATLRELYEGRIVPGVYEGNRVRNARVRAVIAGMFGADPLEIGLTHSTGEGLNTALFGLNWRRDDEILTTNLEHPALFAPLGLLAHRFGVVVRYADIGTGGGDVVGALEAMVTPRTRVIALSHVMWSSGAVIPLADVAEMAHRNGVMVVADAAQAAGQVPIDLHALGVDAYAMAGQKWLCGPEGTGALYVRMERLADIRPTNIRYAQVDPSGYVMPVAGANRYEIGEFYGPAILAQEAALLFLRDTVGLDWLYNRVAMLGQRCWESLERLDGVTVTTPKHAMAGLVCFETEGVTPQDMAARLYERNITIRYVAYPPGPSVARVACGWWNTEEEIDTLAAAVAEIASEAR